MVGNPTDNNEDKTNAGDEALTEKFDRAHKNKEKDDQWYIAINTIPVKREAILEGAAEQVGMSAQTMKMIYHALQFIIPAETLDPIFDKFAMALEGGQANHIYLSMVNATTGEIARTFEATGMKDGKLSSTGELVPIVANNETNPLYAKRSNTTQTMKIFEGSKEEVSRKYLGSLNVMNQMFKKDQALAYHYTDQNCNSTAREAIEGALGNGSITKEMEVMGAGMKRDKFNYAADVENIPAEELEKHLNQEEGKLHAIFLDRTGASQDNTVALTAENTAQ